MAMTSSEEMDGPGPSPESEHRALKRLGVLAAVLLGLATVATAWGAYQANRWGGVMATEFNESVRLSNDAGKLYQEGDAVYNLDATVFVQWAVATTEDNELAAEYIATSLFSESLLTAMETWEAMGDDAPASPFELEEYVVPQWDQGDELEAGSQEATDRAKDANQTGDNYVLLTVLLASVLFIAGIAATLEVVGLRLAFLVIGGVVFVVAAGIMITYPVH